VGLVHRLGGLLAAEVRHLHLQLHRRQPGASGCGDGFQYRDQLVQVAAQQRLAAGQPQLADA
jgi:hypothetical protein